MNKIKKKALCFLRRKKSRIIKDCKGIVSIFLAFLLVPFAYIADILVESGRYGASMALGDQAVSNAEMSTLAHYDEYLLERFQLLSISQKQDLSAVFTDYVQANFDGFSSNLGIMSMDVEGLFPLTNDKVLMRQVLEASKYSVPTHFSSVSLSTIIGSLSGMSNLDGMSNLISSVKNVADSYVSFNTEFEKLVSNSDDVNSKKTTYDKKFEEFKAAVEKAAKKLKAYEDAKKAEAAAKKELDSAKQAYNAAKSQYDAANRAYNNAQSALNSAQSALNNAKNNANNANNVVNNAKKAEEEAKKKYEEIKKQKEQLEKDYTEAKKNPLTPEETKSWEDAIKDINKQLEEAQKAWDNAKKNLSNAQSSAGSASSSLSSAQSKYNSASSSLNSARNNLNSAQSKLNSAQSKLNSAQTKYNKAVAATQKAKNEYDAAIKEAENAKKAYMTAIDNMKKSVTNYKNQVAKARTERDKIATNAANVSSVAGSTSNSNLNAGSISSEINNGKNEIVSSTESVLKQSNVTALEQTITKLGSLYTSISNFKTSSIKTNTTISKSNEKYYVTIKGVVSSGTVKTAMNNIKAKVDASSGALWGKLKAIFGILDSVATVGGVYDKRLTAIVNSGSGYSASEVDNLIKSLANMVNTYNSLIGSTSGLSNTNYFQKISSLLDSTVGFMSSLSGYLGGVIARINEAISQLSTNSLDERFVLSQYLLMSLPDRSNFDTGSNKITGMPFRNAALKPPSGTSPGSYGAFRDVVNLYNNYSAASGGDIVFSGAELEYILMGSRSEIMNQMGTFFQIYFMRMMFDITPIMTNSFVKSIAKTAGQSSYGLGEILIYVAYLIVEPYIDTTVLVSGGCVKMGARQPWMTPSGLPNLMGDMVKASIASGAKSSIISNGKSLTNNAYNGSVGAASSGSGAGSGGFDLNFDYSSYVFYLLVMFNDFDHTLDRFESIIGMEGTQYYSGRGYSFEKGKTYTYISANVETSFTSFLPLDPMAGGGAFKTIVCKQTRGY